MLIILLKILIKNTDNSLLLYGFLFGMVGLVLFSVIIKLLRKSYKNQGKVLQVLLVGKCTESSSQISSENVSSIDTSSVITRTSSELETKTISDKIPLEEDTQTIASQISSELGTQTIVEEILSEFDNEDGDATPRAVRPPSNSIVNSSNLEYINAKVEELNGLDPFADDPWATSIYFAIDVIEKVTKGSGS